MGRIVKICGIRTEEAAIKAIDSGANLLGIILVPNRIRTIDHDVAKAISKHVRNKRKSNEFETVQQIFEFLKNKKFSDSNEYFFEFSKILISNGPFLVGVYRNQAIEEVFRLSNELGIDFIQLHGSEDKGAFLKANSDLNFGIISRYVIPHDVKLMRESFPRFFNKNGFALPLLDSEFGGEGKTIDWSIVEELDFGKFILAGGLNPSNLESTGKIKNIIGYDVSGGVEDENGNKNFTKIDQFIKIGQSL